MTPGDSKRRHIKVQGGYVGPHGPAPEPPKGGSSFRPASTPSRQPHAAMGGVQWEGAAAMLIGLAWTSAEVGSVIDVHDRLRVGFPAATVKHLRSGLQHIQNDPKVWSTLGLTLRSNEFLEKRLTPLQSSFVWTFARILAHATHVLGDQSAAERWMVEPVVALDRRLPIELMTTPAGALAIDEHLTRMEWGVYI